MWRKRGKGARGGGKRMGRPGGNNAEMAMKYAKERYNSPISNAEYQNISRLQGKTMSPDRLRWTARQTAVSQSD